MKRTEERRAKIIRILITYLIYCFSLTDLDDIKNLLTYKIKTCIYCKCQKSIAKIFLKTNHFPLKKKDANNVNE